MTDEGTTRPRRRRRRRGGADPLSPTTVMGRRRRNSSTSSVRVGSHSISPATPPTTLLLMPLLLMMMLFGVVAAAAAAALGASQSAEEAAVAENAIKKATATVGNNNNADHGVGVGIGVGIRPPLRQAQGARLAGGGRRELEGASDSEGDDSEDDSDGSESVHATANRAGPTAKEVAAERAEEARAAAKQKYESRQQQLLQQQHQMSRGEEEQMQQVQQQGRHVGDDEEPETFSVVVSKQEEEGETKTKTTTTTKSPMDVYTKKRRMWESQNMVRYTFLYSYVPNNDDDQQQEQQIEQFMSVRVRNGAVTWAEYADDDKTGTGTGGAVVPSGVSEQIPTIDGLFRVVYDGLMEQTDDSSEGGAGGPSPCAGWTVRYDRRMGYPRIIDRVDRCGGGGSGGSGAGNGYYITVKELKEDAAPPDMTLTNPKLADLARNRVLWAKELAEYGEYSYEYKFGRRMRPVPVRVYHDNVVEVGGTIIGTKQLPKTVPQLFDEIEVAAKDVANKVSTMKVSYDNDLGYPTFIRIKHKTGKTIKIYVKKMRIVEERPEMTVDGPFAPSKMIIAKRRWTEQGIADYTYRYKRRCEEGLIAEDCMAVCVSVRDGLVASATFPADAVGPATPAPSGDGGTGCRADGAGDGAEGGDDRVPQDMAEQLPTVEDLFNELIDGGRVEAVTFDSQLYYPAVGHVVPVIDSPTVRPFFFEVQGLKPASSGGGGGGGGPELIDAAPNRPEEPRFCTSDALSCGNGKFVSRDPSDGCKFRPCPTPTEDGGSEGGGGGGPPELVDAAPGRPGGPRFCNADVKRCSDGTSRSRDPTKGCAFADCPEGPELVSRPGFPGGGSMNGIPYPHQNSCLDDFKLCDDGITKVMRRGPECKFASCDKPGLSPGGDGIDLIQFPPGTNQAEPTPGSNGKPAACPLDGKRCPGPASVWVYRDPMSPGCKDFFPCPPDAELASYSSIGNNNGGGGNGQAPSYHESRGH